MVRPCVASGFAELAVSGLASMYPAFDWSICSGPSWISARVRSRYRTGLDRAIRVTSVRMRREDRSSISSHPLADLGGKRAVGLRHCGLLVCAVPLFVPCGRSFVPACACSRAPRTGAVKAGRRAWACLWRRVSRPCLDDPGQVPRLSGSGRDLACLDAFEVALLVENRPGDAGQPVGERDR